MEFQFTNYGPEIKKNGWIYQTEVFYLGKADLMRINQTKQMILFGGVRR